MKGLKDVAISY